MTRTQRTRAETREQRLQAVRLDDLHVFVDRDEFYRLLTSRRHLIPADDPAANLRGVLEPETGRRFLIEQERLFRSHGNL